MTGSEKGIKRSVDKVNGDEEQQNRKVVKVEAGQKVKAETDQKVEPVKGAWSPEEDEVMKKAVEEFGTDWKAVSSMVKGRTPKQCRDRYKLKLDPSINHGPWTPEEDKTLVKLQSQLGRQWTNIAKMMPGRTENAVKSRFSSLERSRDREWSAEEDLMLRQCRDSGYSFLVISEKFLGKRSEHAVRKRWEKLYMRDLADKIRKELPQQGPPPSQQPQLNGHQAAMPQTHVNGGTETGGNLVIPQDINAPTQMPEPSLVAVPPIELGGAAPRPHEEHDINLHTQPLQLPPPGEKLQHSIDLNNPLQSGNGNFFPQGHMTSTNPEGMPMPSVPFSMPMPMSMKPEQQLGQQPNHAAPMFGDPQAFGQPAGMEAPPGPRVSSRSRNLRKQTTSVTVLQQILGEPLKNL